MHWKTSSILLSMAILVSGLFGANQSKSTLIVLPQTAAKQETLAAKEVRRYVYLRTGQLLPVINSDTLVYEARDLILVAQKDQPLVKNLNDRALKSLLSGLSDQQYVLRTIFNEGRKVVVVAGGDNTGTLYGAYQFAKELGVRFYLHGDVIPDQKIQLKLPVLEKVGKPLFRLRGIQPFHDFPEGPDWWNTDDYKAVIAQLPKLRMNFMGLHTYPEGGVGPEPTVWIGLAEDVHPDGTVKSSYPSSWDSTLRSGNWGYAAEKTSDFSFGAAQLFNRDGHAGDVMRGLEPWPKTPQQSNDVFNRAGKMLGDAFAFAHILGVKTCVGTETPLTIPKPVKEKLKRMGKDPADAKVVQQVYAGMFERIKKAYPLDYYWLWTNEGWTWGGAKDEDIQAVQSDILTALAALKIVEAPFTLATCGWVLGPPKDRAQFDNVFPKKMPFSCINRQVGKAPVEPQFAKIEGRPKWAIPWLEDDPGMISPQLWVGRMRKDAADAFRYGCTGLMGIHWRTRILGPNVSALAQAAWDQNLRKKVDARPAQPKKAAGVVGGQAAHFPNNAIADTEDDVLYQNVRYDVSAYRLEIPNGKYTVTLRFCEPHYGEAGKRVFGVRLQGKQIIENLDIFAKVGQNRALDYHFKDIEVKDGLVEIDFVKIVEFPCIAAIAVEGRAAGANQYEGEPFAKKINCGGGAYKDYIADLEAAPGEPRFLPADDFYADWALHQFGPEAADSIAKIFTRIDCHLPEPSTWIRGPGGIVTNDKPWSEVARSYEFVDKLAALESKIQGAGNRERFDYWLDNVRFMKAMARVGCMLGQMDSLMKQVTEEKDEVVKRKLAREQVLPLRRRLVQQWGEMTTYLLGTVNTTGEMGTVANVEQHSMKHLNLLAKHDKALVELLDSELPADTQPWKDYRGVDRLVIPTARTSLQAGENLRLKTIFLSQSQPREAVLYWRPMGQGDFSKVPLEHVTRGVYSATVTSEVIDGQDLEYYVKVTGAKGKPLYFPATAPDINQTVVVIDSR